MYYIIISVYFLTCVLIMYLKEMLALIVIYGLLLVVLALSAYCFVSSEPAKPQVQLMITRVHIFTDNRITKKLQKNLTKMVQRPVIQETHCSASIRSSRPCRRSKQLASSSSSSDTVTPSGFQPATSNTHLKRVFKTGN